MKVRSHDCAKSQAADWKVFGSKSLNSNFRVILHQPESWSISISEYFVIESIDRSVTYNTITLTMIP